MPDVEFVAPVHKRKLLRKTTEENRRFTEQISECTSGADLLIVTPLIADSAAFLMLMMPLTADSIVFLLIVTPLIAL